MFALAMTDPRWHRFMLEEDVVGDVAFWTPTPWQVQLQTGTTVGFMLKAPIRKIGGYGILQRYEEYPLDELWHEHGTATGVTSLEELRERIFGFAERRSKVQPGANPKVGCMVLNQCVFLPPSDQVAPEELGISFPRQVVKWKGFAGQLELAPIDKVLSQSKRFQLVDSNKTSWELKKSKKRISQGQFRSHVLTAYQNRCAFTGETCLAALEAAHIQPFVDYSSNHIQNGLCLRRDVHRLFDNGLLGLDDNMTVVASLKLDSTAYRSLEGRKINLPSSTSEHPSLAAVQYHRDQVLRR